MSGARDLEALHGFIDARQAAPYAWGRDANDCVGFALGAVAVQTGIVAAVAAQWHDERSAIRTIARLGGIEAAFDAHFDRVPPALARRGDVAGVFDEARGLHVMVVEGATLVGPGEAGNFRLPRSAMVIAWNAETGRSAPRGAEPEASAS
jgi:hypothetical protein